MSNKFKKFWEDTENNLSHNHLDKIYGLINNDSQINFNKKNIIIRYWPNKSQEETKT